jgi:hypothetical protein
MKVNLSKNRLHKHIQHQSEDKNKLETHITILAADRLCWPLSKLAQTEPHVTENYELGFLKSIFRNNGYRWKQIQWPFRPLARATKPSTTPMLITFLPCVQTNDSKISMLSKHNIKDVGLQPATPPSPASSGL